jgi:hypothetical protein
MACDEITSAQEIQQFGGRGISEYASIAGHCSAVKNFDTVS